MGSVISNFKLAHTNAHFSTKTHEAYPKLESIINLKNKQFSNLLSGPKNTHWQISYTVFSPLS